MFMLPCLFLRIALQASIVFWESIGQATKETAQVVEKTVQHSVDLLKSFLQKTHLVHIRGNLYKIERGLMSAMPRVKMPKIADILYLPSRSAA
ncbi:MAG TPA: hypothetical protein VLB83_01205 [Candidatus Paceibacterota bacterium]|nr:hypothetical protein [Candidatus Paceibacterota bacterium]